MDALIISDIQYDFLPGGALEVNNGDEVIPLINEIQPRFPLVIATQDWHPKDHKSFASAHPGKQVFDTTTLGGLEQILWPNHCVQGTRGAEISGNLSLNQVEAIFRKGMDPEIDSYSCFFDNGKQKSTGLADYLKGRGVTKVFVVGLAADFCVGFTVLDAIDQGFETILLEDATRAISSEGFDVMKSKITSKGGFVYNSDSL